jgi:putative transposase
MSELRKANPGSTYFLTLTVVGWIDVFGRKIYTDEVINNLRFCQEKKGLELFAYVIMPNHLHLVCRREKGLLSDLLRDFKSFSAKRLLESIEQNPQESRKEWMLHLFRYYAKYHKQNAEMMFWQKTNHPVELFSGKVVEQKIEYIHQNPVRANIVAEPQHYIYSSAYPLSELKVLDF